jgi:adenylate cyclase
LIQTLLASGVVGIGFDVVFAEADRMSPGHYSKYLTDISPALRQELGGLPNNDELLASVINQGPVVLGQSAYPRPLDTVKTPIPQVPVLRMGKVYQGVFNSFPAIVRNIPILEDAAKGVGFFNLLPERDGIVRRVPLLIEIDGVLVPALSLELVRALAGPKVPYVIRSDEAGISSIGLAGIDIPTDRDGRMWLNYARDDRSTYVSAKDVLSGAVSRERLQGRLVLVGTSAAGLFDIKSTPLDAAMPGVAVQAQLLETFLTKSFLTRPHYALGAELLMLAFMGLLLIAIVPVTGAWLTLLSGVSVAVILASGSWMLFKEYGLLIDVSFPLLSGLVLYTVLVLISYFREEVRRRQVRVAFNQYLSPDLVEQLAKDPNRLVLGGETKEITVLFCDVRGFTGISEGFKDDPQGLTRLINRLLTPLSEAILENGGTIDKYMGDSVMAFWNAPLDDPNHASHACAAALDMLERVADLNRELAEEAERRNAPNRPIRIGIGINSGVCVVGNLGSSVRFDYSVLGDTVNLASRLEGQTKTYGTSIILGDSVAEKVSGSYALIVVDQVRVKGRREPAKIYSIVGDAEYFLRPEYQQFTELMNAFHAAYRSQEWAEARDILNEICAPAAKLGLAPLAEAYHERLIKLEASPPAAAWDGVYEAEMK